MHYSRNIDSYDDYEEYDTYIARQKEPMSRKAARKETPSQKQHHLEVLAQVAEEWDDSRSGFNPTFSSSRHERAWILNYLGGFYEDQIISDVLRQVKGGKEATVYCCRAHPAREVDLIAAKVYRPRIFRTMKNDYIYREGGDIADDSGRSALRSRRAKLAMQKKTEFGNALLHGAWLSNEYAALHTLHLAGADVPRPFAMSDNAILMDYVGEENAPAPPLVNVRLERSEARTLFDRLIENIYLMLSHDVVHGDLSAHNILYWQGDVTIIDFPQAVAPHVNPHAQMIFLRDVERVCQYFARYGITADARELARDIWSRHLPL